MGKGSCAPRLSLARHETQLDIAEVGDYVPNHQKPIIFQVKLEIVGEVGALGKQHKVRETERTRHNLVGLLLVDVQLRHRITHRHSLGCEWALATERERIANVFNVNILGRQKCHVPANLLEIQ